METLLVTAEALGVFLLGLAARLAVLLGVVALFAIPVGLILAGMRGVGLLRERALGLTRVDGLVWRDSSYYAPGHTWVRRIRAGAVRVGLDDLAQRLLRESQAVVLPVPGSELREGEVATVVRCGDKRGEIVSPVDGRVTAVNEAVRRDPSLIHRDPYARGWLFTVEPRNARYTGLLRGEPARRWLADESARLARFVEHELGFAAADGGEPIVPTASLLTEAQWGAVSRIFFKTGDGR